jgi:hypothetical protein
MSITQFNATYVQEEDRVLFRFNTSEQQEFRLWLTRVAVKDLMGLTTQGAVAALVRERPVAQAQAQAIVEFKQQAKVANPQFTTFTPAMTLPLGEEALLVRGMRLTVAPDKMALELMLPQNRVMTMAVTADMLGQIRVLLQKIDEHAGWGLTAQQVAPSLILNDLADLPDDGSDAPKRLH